MRPRDETSHFGLLSSAFGAVQRARNSRTQRLAGSMLLNCTWMDLICASENRPMARSRRARSFSCGQLFSSTRALLPLSAAAGCSECTRCGSWQDARWFRCRTRPPCRLLCLACCAGRFWRVGRPPWPPRQRRATLCSVLARCASPPFVRAHARCCTRERDRLLPTAPPSRRASRARKPSGSRRRASLPSCLKRCARAAPSCALATHRR